MKIKYAGAFCAAGMATLPLALCGGSAFLIVNIQILAAPVFLAASAVAFATASFTRGSKAAGRM